MRTRRSGAAAAALGAALALALAACGGSPAPTSPAPPAPGASGYFVGRGGGGIGASVDFVGFDATVRALRRALPGDGPPPPVGVASIVNDSGAWRPLPVFVGLLPDGRIVPLLPARRALGDRDDAAARRARSMLPLAALIPPGGSAMTYLVATSPPEELAGIRMRVGAEAVATLRPQPR